MAMPTFVAAGGGYGATGNATPGIPANVIAGDLLLVFIETSNQDMPATPTGWTPIDNSPQGVGDAGGASATKLYAYWRRYGTDVTAVALGDPGEHCYSVMLAFRGAADPTHASAGGTDATEDTNVSIAGTTTTVDDCLVVIACARSSEIATAEFDGWTNASLASLTERFDLGTTSGNGGGLGIATGELASAGATGTTTATLTTNAVKAFLTIALAPAVTPYVVAVGATASASATGTVSWPSGHAAGDIGLLFFETCNEAVSAPDGWAEIANSPQGTGTGGTDPATRLTAFWKRATSASESSISMPDVGDHWAGWITVIHNCVDTGDPVNASSGGVKASASTSSSIAGVTTTVDNCLIVIASARDNDAIGNAYSDWTNATLDHGALGLKGGGSTNGNGGGIGTAVGFKGTAGATGTTTATINASVVEGFMTVALIPPAGKARSFAVVIA